MKKSIPWIILYIYCFLIFFYSSESAPGKSLGIQSFVISNSIYIHILEYFILTLLIYFALHSTLKKRIVLPSFLFAVLFSLSDEVHQLFVPGRFYSYGDIVADAFGSLLFISINYLYHENPHRVSHSRL